MSDDLKHAVAMAAAALPWDGCTVGLGSGSTLAIAIMELGRRVREEKLRITGVPTSYQARLLAHEHGVPVNDMMDVPRLDLAIDGADEVDPAGHLIKGAGAAHVQEKIVAAAAERFVVVVDEAKLVQRLGERCPVPIEVIPLAISYVLRRLRELGFDPQFRKAVGKVGPIVSDNGNPIVDIRLEAGRDPEQLSAQLNAIPGVVGHGLFVGMTNEVLVARSGPDGTSIERIALRRTI